MAVGRARIPFSEGRNMSERAVRMLAVVGAAALLILGFDGLTFAVTGSALVLGHTNTESTPTTLSNGGAGPALSLLTHSKTSPPFTTNARGRVANLNADRVDGLTANEILTTSIRATLPSGQTEVGVFAAQSPSTAVAAINFPIPVKSTSGGFAFYVPFGQHWPGCPGIVNGVPTAAPGNFCAYDLDNAGVSGSVSVSPLGAYVTARHYPAAPTSIRGVWVFHAL